VLSFQSEKSRAVLVGASHFPRDSEHLLPIPQVANNLDELTRLLLDPAVVGMPSTCIQALLDKANIQEVYEALDVSANEAEDTLLFYYTGHGLIGRSSSELLLATAGTIEAQAESNALSFEKIRRSILNSPAKTKILILDCCFSGRAFENMGPVSELVQANLDLRGTFAIASAPPNRPALAPTGAKFTAFTGELVRVLNEGIDNGREEISLKELYDAVRTAIKKKPDLPEPRHANFQDADALRVARNAWSRVPRIAPGRLDYSALVPVLELPADAEVFSVAVSGDNRTIAAGSNGVVLLWRGETAVHTWTSAPEPRRITDVHERFVYAVAFSPDGHRLATGAEDGVVHLRDVNRDEAVWRHKYHDEAVYSVAFSSDGAFLATGGYDRKVRILDARNGAERRILPRDYRVSSVAFSPTADPKVVAIGGLDNSVTLWNLVTGTTRLPEPHYSSVERVVFSPDGTRLASCGLDKAVRVWDARDPTKGHLWHGTQHEYLVRGLAFSPDGGTLASASWDKTVKLWNAETGEPTDLPWRDDRPRHSDWVWSVAFSPDGRVLASAGSDGKIILWVLRNA
jgi:hypothetical protein